MIDRLAPDQHRTLALAAAAAIILMAALGFMFGNPYLRAAVVGALIAFRIEILRPYRVRGEAERTVLPMANMQEQALAYMADIGEEDPQAPDWERAQRKRRLQEQLDATLLVIGDLVNRQLLSPEIAQRAIAVLPGRFRHGPHLAAELRDALVLAIARDRAGGAQTLAPRSLLQIEGFPERGPYPDQPSPFI